MTAQWLSLKQRSICTTAVVLQLLLPVCPGERGIHTHTASTSHALRPSFQACDVNIRGVQFFGGQVFVGSLTHGN